MRKIQISRGDRYGHLTVLEEVEQYISPSGQKHRQVLCRCDCGTEKVVRLAGLRSSRTKSCGCKRGDFVAKAKTTHGKTGTYEHRVWKGMRKRCMNPKSSVWENYGGRGITICERWNDFENFLSDMGKAPSEKHQLDRINNDGPYSPENCRWATIIQQHNNTRASHYLTHKGKTQTIAEWAKELDMPYDTLHCRIKYYGWSVERALSQPVRV